MLHFAAMVKLLCYNLHHWLGDRMSISLTCSCTTTEIWHQQWLKQMAGITIARNGDATKDVRRRIGVAGTAFATLCKVWDSRMEPLSLKSVWSVFDLCFCVKLSAGRCARFALLLWWALPLWRCLWRATRVEIVSSDPLKDTPTHREVFCAAASPGAEELLRDRRLRWAGHCLRMREDDPCREDMVKAQSGGDRGIDCAAVLSAQEMCWRLSQRGLCGVKIKYNFAD